MKEHISERIENNRFEKSNRLFLILAIISVPLVIVQVRLSPKIFDSTVGVLDFVTFSSPILLFVYSRYRFRKWGGQFIEWDETGVIYKARESTTTEIPYDSIQDIIINLDTIVFKLTDGNENTLLIEDYQEYEDRIRIKANFEKMKNNA